MTAGKEEKYLDPGLMQKTDELIAFLESQGQGAPKMGLIYSDSRDGKTLIAKEYSKKHKVLYISCLHMHTPMWLLEDICKTIDENSTKARSLVAQMDKAVTLLQKHSKPLVLDEAGYLLLSNGKLLSLVLELQTRSDRPIILMGRADLYSGLKRQKPQILSHFPEGAIVEFEPKTKKASAVAGTTAETQKQKRSTVAKK